ncbi:hypothetical protein [Mammaliicoccus sp. Dog046]|uniref:hypothetical protein n=1 Tax=Mammaliicoccus sp. Dog046 TaxID=3034233 RepID=UPI002B25EFB9|nr:hypothetical protein [Mammaliicoccus sp. Dog046]WQK85868.1 hypothetical protein P3U32_02225 [Mammaliicoccus sp. Dog046]
MFKLHKDYFRNGRGYHFKTILFSFLFSLVTWAALVALPFGTVVLGMVIADDPQDGNSKIYVVISMIIGVIIAFIVCFLLILFILSPLYCGIIQLYKNTDLGKQSKFRHLITFFKKGNYGKTLKLTSLLLIIGVMIGFITSSIISPLFSIFNMSLYYFVPSYIDITEGSLIGHLLTIVMLIGISILCIPFYYLMIYLMNVVLVHVDQSSLPTLNKFSIAWKITTKGPNSSWRLLFSNLLYFVIILVAITVFQIIIALPMQNSPTILSTILSFPSTLLMLFILTILTYLISGSMINFYHQNKNAIYPTETPATDE